MPKKLKSSKRKFYRTVVTVEVLSEEPISGHVTLEQIGEFIDTGGGSGQVEIGESVKVDASTMAKLLMAQGSDPGFFRLDEYGQEDS